MAKLNLFQIGRGSEVTVALLPVGSRSEVPEQTVTLNGAAAALASTLTVTALAEPIAASPTSPIFLSFVDALDEADRFVKVVAPAAAGDTLLTIEPLKRAISDASTAVHPVKLQARTSADINSSSNDVTTTVFETGGFNDGIISSVGYTISSPGNFLPLDAGYRTCLFAFNSFRELWLSLKLPSPGQGYTTGYIYRGVASVSNIPTTVPADGIISANLDFTIRGELQITDPA